MRASDYRVIVVLGATGIALVIISGCLFWKYSWLKIQVAFASEQTHIFEEMQIQATQADAAGAAGCLEYVMNYYPSGSKQETGSRLDRIVERERSETAQSIMKILRSKTGQDLGTNAELWIEKFKRR